MIFIKLQLIGMSLIGRMEYVQVFGFHGLLGGGNAKIFGIFNPKIGEMIQFDDRIFQMGWFNHQLVYVAKKTPLQQFHYKTLPEKHEAIQ